MTVLYASFYGLYFGAWPFMSRYLLALSPLYAVLWGGTIYAMWRWVTQQTSVVLASGLSIILPMLAIGLDLRAYRKGDHHLMFQVVEWVEANVPENTWVAAGQSGAVGYFHDRTLNLDGKVNPDALKARKRGETWKYAAESKADYLADWHDMLAGIGSDPEIARNFDLIVDDPDINLAVFKRKSQ
jgi:hypothetical protein